MGKAADSARGPTEVASPQKMKMKMGHGFPAVRAVVDNETVTGLVQFRLAGDFLGGGKKVAEDAMVFRRHGRMASMVLFGNEKNMDRGLGGNVPEGEHVVILVDNVGYDFTVEDPLKDRFGHRPFPNRWSVRGVGGRSDGHGRG